MENRDRHQKPRSAGIVALPPESRLDSMPARGAAEVVGVLRSAGPSCEGRVPIGMWKTGWLAQPEGAV